jgi:hypothetical protein
VLCRIDILWKCLLRRAFYLPSVWSRPPYQRDELQFIDTSLGVRRHWWHATVLNRIRQSYLCKCPHLAFQSTKLPSKHSVQLMLSTLVLHVKSLPLWNGSFWYQETCYRSLFVQKAAFPKEYITFHFCLKNLHLLLCILIFLHKSLDVHVLPVSKVLCMIPGLLRSRGLSHSPPWLFICPPRIFIYPRMQRLTYHNMCGSLLL